MSFKRILAVGLVFMGACVGWYILGTATSVRSHDTQNRLGENVSQMWGAPLTQMAPRFTVQTPGTNQHRPVVPAKNDITVDLQLAHRKKGLNWYPTYTCDFDGRYTIANSDEVTQKVRLQFTFPARDGTYDAFAVMVDEAPLEIPIDTQSGVAEILELSPGESRAFRVTYRTRGMAAWRYEPAPEVGRVRDFNLRVATNFSKVDYPDDGLSPMTVEESDEGMVLAWSAQDLITREGVGVLMPERLNPGPLTSRITFFAPVCLLFFFVLVGTINIVYGVNIHPMHYLFVAAGFFAFHLLLSYMAGIVDVHLAFVISAVVSVGLVTGYLSGALRGQFPWKVAAAGQFFFLVLFSYSFFFKGITGITVAIGSVVTLAVLMKVTAHVDWEKVFEQAALPTRGEGTSGLERVPPTEPAGGEA